MDFLQNNSLYVVGIISATIWLGIFVFLMGLEKRVQKLESGDLGDE